VLPNENDVNDARVYKKGGLTPISESLEVSSMTPNLKKTNEFGDIQKFCFVEKPSASPSSSSLSFEGLSSFGY
jgi:hypothetical protein